MKKFIIQCLCFLCPFMILVCLAEMYMRSLPNSYKQKEMWMQAHAKEVEVLILGNSHGLFGLCPSYITSKKVYNLCQVSQIFEYDYYLLQRYAKSYAKLTDLILIADNSNLFDVPLEQSEWFRCIYYRLYMGYRKHSLWSKYGFELSNIQACKMKLFANNQECDSLGWNGSYTLMNRLPDYLSEKEIEQAVRRHYCKDWTIAENNYKTLERIVNWCNERHVRVLLIQAPVTNGYYNKIEKRQIDFHKRLYKLSNVRVIDYSKDERFTEGDFYDADHLTDEGAKKWSRIINNDLMEK